MGGGKPSVLVTGASTGIGEACALHLDKLGFKVFAGVRRPEDADRLAGQGSGDLSPVILDVTNQEQINLTFKSIEQELGKLHGLVNNAGIVVAGPLEFLALDDVRKQLEVNLIGQIAVTQAALPLIRKTKGRIVNVGSIGGRFATGFVGPYCMSKFAMEAFNDALRHELAPWQIHVALIEPGNIKTPLWNRSIEAAEKMRAQLPEGAESYYGTQADKMFELSRKQSEAGIPPTAVAKAVEHALTATRPKTRYLVGVDARIQAVLARFVPDRAKDRLFFWQLGFRQEL